MNQLVHYQQKGSHCKPYKFFQHTIRDYSSTSIAQYLVNYCPLHTKQRNEAISMLDDNTAYAFLQEAYITEIKSRHNSGNHDK